MKERKIKKGDKALEDFLRRASEGGLTDDFEKEAAEGFKTLETQGEALELKKSTDSRMAELLSERRKKRPLPWAMAAGIVFIIGIIAFFLRDNFSDRQVSLVNRPQIEKPAVLAPADLPSVGNQTETQGPAENTAAAAEPEQLKSDERILKKNTPEKKAEVPAMKTTAASREKSTEIPLQETADNMATAAPAAQSYVDQNSRVQKGIPVNVDAEQLPVGTGKKKSDKSLNHQAQPASAFKTMRAEFVTDSTAIYIIEAFRPVIPADLNKSFEAVLTISENGVIKKARITGKNELSGKEEKLVEKLLTELEVDKLKRRQSLSREVPVSYRP